MEAKKIIITGGATRIGSAIAKSLAGYDVDITIHFNKSINLSNSLFEILCVALPLSFFFRVLLEKLYFPFLN